MDMHEERVLSPGAKFRRGLSTRRGPPGVAWSSGSRIIAAYLTLTIPPILSYSHPSNFALRLCLSFRPSTYHRLSRRFHFRPRSFLRRGTMRPRCTYARAF